FDGVDDLGGAGGDVGQQHRGDPVRVLGAALQVQAAGDGVVGDDPVVALQRRPTGGVEHAVVAEVAEQRPDVHRLVAGRVDHVVDGEHGLFSADLVFQGEVDPVVG